MTLRPAFSGSRALRLTMIAAAVMNLSCTSTQALDKVAPRDADRYARSIISRLRYETYEQFEPSLAPVLRTAPNTSTTLIGVVQPALIRIGGIDSVQLVDAAAFFSAGRKATERWLTYQVFGDRGLLLMKVGLVEDSSGRLLESLIFQPEIQTLQTQNDFRRHVKFPQLLMLIAAMGVGALSLAAALLVIRAPVPRKYLWGLASLIGVSGVTMDWTSGDIFFQPFSIFALSAMFSRDGFAGAWQIAVAFPIGAILALQRRYRALHAPLGPNSKATSGNPSKA